MTLAPENPEFLTNVATACWRAGDSAAAEGYFRRTLALEPGHYRANHNLGALLSQQHRLGDALPYLEAAAREPGCETDTLLNLATVYERLNRLAEAAAVVDRIAETDHPRVSFLRGRLLRRQGDTAAALRLLNEGRVRFDFEALGLEFAAEWCHEIMLCADLEGEVDLAFESLLAVKSYRRRAFGPMEKNEYLDEVRQWRRQGNTADRPAARGGADAAQSGALPAQVFFVGFPRSGTTLLEVILDSHPEIATTNEAVILSSVLRGNERADAETMRRRYLETFNELCGELGPASVIVDKLPLNAIYCRAIDEYFPQARILMALRDPRDVVLSCLMQRFSLNPAMRNFETLESTVTLYEEVMGLWLEARPALRLPWLEYRYEDLVADRDAVLARIMEFIGVQWHADMDGYRDKAASRQIISPSYRDVTEPIYKRATGRWRAYESKLAPVLDRLAPFVTAFGYEP